MQKVFVYGTLMRGQINHKCYLSNSEYIGTGEISGYALYAVSYFPGVIPEVGEKVKGEIFRVDNDILRSLDCLEAEGNLYLRKMIEIQTDSEIINAYIYIWNRSVNHTRKLSYGEQPWKGE